jgi:beta-glucuronidase
LAAPELQASAEQAFALPTVTIPLKAAMISRFVSNESPDLNYRAAASVELSARTDVALPHTWAALGCWPDHVGVALYTIVFACPPEWAQQFVRVEFEAVFHTAQVYLNGKPVGQHFGKGYTAFTCDLSHALNPGQFNALLVHVNNSPSDTILPRMKSYDWANDGGLTRPVSLLISPRVFIERIEIDATPDLKTDHADVAVRAAVRNTLDTPQTVQLIAEVRAEDFAVGAPWQKPATATIPAQTTTTVLLQSIRLSSPKLWHFDAPNLYTATVDLHSESGAHQVSDTFGIRKFEARGAEFNLNGEPVRLMGVERMAGSHPELGMAETTAWIEANHRDMKELNCVFTRVHWAQDKRVLDFCDRNGILMQEEVPAWGPDTFHDTTPELQRQLEENGLKQLREMIARDRNHPCIVSWGLCNEVDGKNPRSRDFARAIAAEARRLDPSRLLTYASHTLGSHPEEDMAGEFDFISTNEYYGSWAPGGPPDVRAHLDRICKAFPDKPIVVSEYGWCECQPKMAPGDEHRIEIITSHTDVIREFPQVAGAIYFDYNDYRTLVGDKGEGAFRQRVHGVVDLYANRKPSFQALRAQASPVESVTLKRLTATDFRLEGVTRKTMPAYALRGYRVRWVAYGYDDLPMEGKFDDLPTIQPGGAIVSSASLSEAGLRRVVAEILRPTGFSVAAAEWNSAKPATPGPD